MILLALCIDEHGNTFIRFKEKNMFQIYQRNYWGGRKLTLETGKVARQADGAIIATLGETSVYVQLSLNQQSLVRFLSIDGQLSGKGLAAGKIPGGFSSVSRPSENETVSRLIDRPIRPLFPKNFKCETQVICTVCHMIWKTTLILWL